MRWGWCGWDRGLLLGLIGLLFLVMEIAGCKLIVLLCGVKFAFLECSGSNNWCYGIAIKLLQQSFTH